MIRFYLDGTEVVNPKGWEGMKSVLKRDADTDGIYVYQDQDVEFTGDGYDYIKSIADQNGYCAQIDCEVTITRNGDTKRLLSGHIFISDCTFNEKAVTVTAKVKDASFYSMIEYNKGVEAVVSAGKSMNGIDITPAPKFFLGVYDTENNLNKTAYSVRVYDAFRYLVDFMSDGNMSFASDSLDYLGELNNLVITSGEKLSCPTLAVYGSPAIPAFSFEKLFTEVKKRYPIGSIIESPYQNPTLRIETLSYFSTTDKSPIAFENIDDIKTRFDQNRIFSKLHLGSSTTLNGTLFNSFPEDIDWFGFKDESFIVQTKCNVDNELDLSAEWVVSSNVIQSCVETGDTTYDDQLFLISATLTSATAGRTRNTNFLQLDPVLDPHVYFYNEDLTNKAVAERYLGLVPASIANYFSPAGTGNFAAARSANTTISGTSFVQFKCPLDVESLDNGGYYDTTNYSYLAFNGGVFDFTYKCDVNVMYTTNPTMRRGGFVWFKIYDPDGNLRAETPKRPSAYGYLNPVQGGIPYTIRVTLSENETVEMWFASQVDPPATTVNIEFTRNSYWTCEANTGTGGVFQEYNPADYPIQIHEFGYPLSQADFEQIIASPTGLFRFYLDKQVQRYGWLSELNYTHATGIATVKLISSKTVANGN